MAEPDAPRTDAPPSAPVGGAEAPPTAPSPSPARPRPLRQLGRVLRFVVPHRALAALSFLLFVLQAATGNGRVLLVYPVATRVFHVAESSKYEGVGGADAKDAAEGIRIAERKAGRLLGVLNDLVTSMNSVTQAWVPDSWIRKVTTGPVTPEQKQEAEALRRDEYATLLTVGVLFLFLMIVMSLSAFFEDYVNEMLRLRILMDVRRDLCAKLLEQPLSFYDARHRGDLVQRVMEDVYGFSIGLKLMLSSLPEGFLNITFGIAILAGLSPELTGVCVGGLLFFLPLRRLTRKVKKRAAKRQAGAAKRVEVLLQIVSGIRTVKAFRAEERKVSEFREADRAVYRQSLKVQRTKSLSDAATEFVNNVLMMILLVGGGWMMLRGYLGLSPIVLIVFMGLLANLYKPAKKLIRDMNATNDAMASVDRVFEVIDLPPPPPDPAGARAFSGIREAVRFEGVGFSYKPGLPVLEDVTFEIPRGGTVALVGPSGGGKSTVCDLLLRFYEPTSGRITVDGVPLGSFSRTSFLDRTAVVTQEPFLFHASIEENVRMGRPGATSDEVTAAAKDAQIHEHVASLPQGYATEVGERGARLSGGQRQRITIARALVRNPDLLVLDEATASLDTESERGVQQALDRLREGRTTLVVAHRLSTVRNADRIIVLEGGRVVDQGTHEDLLRRGGLYARLCAMQDLGSPPALSGPPGSEEPLLAPTAPADGDDVEEPE